jgi:hypothetical protein
MLEAKAGRSSGDANFWDWDAGVPVLAFSIRKEEIISSVTKTSKKNSRMLVKLIDASALTHSRWRTKTASRG